MNEVKQNTVTPVQEKAIALRNGMQVGNLYVRAYDHLFDDKVTVYVSDIKDTANKVALKKEQLEDLIELADFFQSAVKAEMYKNEAQYALDMVQEITNK